MRYAHTVEQVRAAESALMATLPDGALMQRAATGLATVCIELMGQAYGARVLLLVGAGSNGGDALYAGARLARRGSQVEALLLAADTHGPGLAAFQAAGGRVVETLGDYDLVVDGVVGIGGRPGLRDRTADVVEALEAAAVPIVAVDVPSGIDVDSGAVSGAHVVADVTVTFGTHKIGLLLDPAAAAAGSVELIDIGLGPYLGPPAVEALQADDVGLLLPVPDHAAHKYTRGVVGVSAGSEQYVGAGLLATSAAVVSGFAGMVRYSGPSADLVRARYPEVVVGVGQVQAWVVGPGMGADQGDEVARVLDEGVPTVVDADGLRFIPERFTMPAVLTPHAGELARLLDVDRDEVEGEMLRAATTASQRWNAVVLLKGARSVTAAPDGRVRVNTTGVPWLGTAGAGDVLSGVVGALLASGLDPFDAASVGAWLHGAAGTLASDGGPMSASRLLDALPEATRLVLA
jgi:hydroxyethylthiazole kinase-like uncharacterized protein yjeF